ncbi:hypothetical protein C8Q76DRAFT_797910 [Earliella scabrosa]|nr:hypothetical protein C8Q76DRAFT_797910 [Earliella scabrosa]
MSLNLLRYNPKDYYVGTAVYPSDNVGVPFGDELDPPSIPPTPPPSVSEDSGLHVYSPPTDYFTPFSSSTLPPLSTVFPTPTLPGPLVPISYGRNTLPKPQVMSPDVSASMPYSDLAQDHDLAESRATEPIVQTAAQFDNKKEPHYRDDDRALISWTPDLVDKPISLRSLPPGSSNPTYPSFLPWSSGNPDTQQAVRCFRDTTVAARYSSAGSPSEVSTQRHTRSVSTPPFYAQGCTTGELVPVTPVDTASTYHPTSHSDPLTGSIEHISSSFYTHPTKPETISASRILSTDSHLLQSTPPYAEERGSWPSPSTASAMQAQNRDSHMDIQLDLPS